MPSMTRPRDLTHAPRFEMLAARAIWLLIVFLCLYLGIRS
jgi:hypothetical protein